MKSMKRAERRSKTAAKMKQRVRRMEMKYGETWEQAVAGRAYYGFSKRSWDSKGSMRDGDYLSGHSYPSCDCFRCYRVAKSKKRLPVGQRPWLDQRIRNEWSVKTSR